MTNYEIYIFLLCLIVFILLTTLSVVSIYLIVSMYLRFVKEGNEDNKLIEEYNKLKLKKQSKVGKVLDYALTAIMVGFFAIIFSGSLYINCTQNTYFNNVPTYRVVRTGSMAKKHKDNKYLFNNDLNDQIQTFDLILTYKVPEEKDLKLYDIVVYKVDDILVVHRIVGIEEPNDKHPNERYFLLQGDAVDSADRFPVYYSQIQGIYRGERIPFIGSFVLFMQSPAGWLCLLLVVGVVIATPIIENSISKAKKNRLIAIGFTDGNGNKVSVISINVNRPINSVNYVESVNEIALTEDRFNSLRGKKNEKSFSEKLDVLSYEDTCRYIDLVNYIDSFGVLGNSVGDKIKSYKYKNKSVIKMAVKGKTINLYLALNPQDYNNTKYKFIDASLIKKYSSTPIRIKITSNRQLKYAKELINFLISGFNKGDKYENC